MNYITREKILIVDDISLNVDILVGFLSSSFKIITAMDGEEAIDAIEEHQDEILLILLDLSTPKVNGYEVLVAVKKFGLQNEIPVLIISSDTSIEAERFALSLGAADFIRKPFDPVITVKRINNLIELFTYKSSIEAQLESQIIKLRNKTTQLEKYRTSIIDIIGTIVEFRSLESGEHIQRVKNYTRIIAEYAARMFKEYNLTNNTIDMITNASALHDIGKIAIPDNILLKKDRLTNEEFEIMKTHTEKGSEMIIDIKDAWDEKYDLVCYEICRFHHERYDGKGYPDRLVGDEIPISAQIVSIADVYDALTHERCYKSAFSSEEAYDMIINNKCGVFNPKLMQVFDKCKNVLKELI